MKKNQINLCYVRMAFKVGIFNGFSRCMLAPMDKD